MQQKKTFCGSCFMSISRPESCLNRFCKSKLVCFDAQTWQLLKMLPKFRAKKSVTVQNNSNLLLKLIRNSHEHYNFLQFTQIKNYVQKLLKEPGIVCITLWYQSTFNEDPVYSDQPLYLHATLAPKLFWVTLTWKMTRPPIFLDLVLWSGSTLHFYYLSMSYWCE